MDYKRKSKDEILELLRQAAQRLYPDSTWSGLAYGSFEWLLASLCAEATDLTGYYLDQRAKNAYIGTADSRRDARAICENVGYYPTEKTASNTTLSITATNNVTIPKGSVFVDSAGTQFATVSELALSTETTLTGTVAAVNAVYEQLTFRAFGDPSEVFSLDRDDVITDYLSVWVDGVSYDLVDDFSFSTGASNHYVFDFDESDKFVLRFGDGTYGRRLGADATIVVDLFHGGGPEGNGIAAGAITTLSSTITGQDNIATITNTSSTSGGAGATSITKMRNQLRSSVSAISGLVSEDHVPGVVGRELAWIADATVDSSFTTTNGVYVPTYTVYAYPSSDTVTSMSVAQKSELNALLANRGMLGVTWTCDDGYAAPIEIEAEVHITQKSLQTQKEAEIREALLDKFSIDNIGFQQEYTANDILSTIMQVPDVTYARLTRFSKVPQPILTSGTASALNCFADIDIDRMGNTAEDGYFGFEATSSTAAYSVFYRPIVPTTITSTYVQDDSQNWLVSEYTYTGAELNDVDGPYIVVGGSSKVNFKQNSIVMMADEYNGTTYDKKYIMGITWTDDVGATYTGYYHIADTTSPGMLISTENYNAPIGGTAIPVGGLANDLYPSIIVRIFKDQTVGSLQTQAGDKFSIGYNTSNALYLATSPAGKVSVSRPSYIAITESHLYTTTDTWTSSTGSLRARLHISSPFTVADKWAIYTTPNKADILGKITKHKKEVYTLPNSNITIRFI